MPSVVVHGSAVFEWLEGRRFLMHRARSDHPDFPDGLSIIGHMESLTVSAHNRFLIARNEYEG